MSDWFEEWFSSEEYLTVYAHRDEKEAQQLLELILKNVRLSKESRILDLACGAGRHSIAFAQKGYNVTAIDLSESLLNIGRKEASKLGLQIEFSKQDIRTVKVEGFFQLVLNLFTSFGYFENDRENFDIFRTAYRYLFKDGYFVFDFLNESYVKSHLVPFSEDEKNSCIIKQSRSIESGSVVKKIELRFGDKQQVFFEKVKLYDYNILTNELQKTGFMIAGLYGDYNGGKFNKETSSRLIAICKK
jgi:2-polyprenyl-3-methyl-5-hydroxy-6-metoxy-1,4-benzoquinol methylase